MAKALVIPVVFLAAFSATALPRLKMRPEVIVDGALKAKVLDNSRGIPAATPQGATYRVTRGTESKEVKIFEPLDIWRQRAEIGTWEDREGNVMKLARAVSLVPEMDRFECTREALSKKLAEMESAFTGGDAELAAWKEAWGVKGTGKFIKASDGVNYWVEFRFKEEVRPSDAEKLLRAFERSLAANTRGTYGVKKTSKWWEMKDGRYRFLTDLAPGRGRQFIKDALSYMGALRKGFEFYVPPSREISTCTVRVFSKIGEYREYRSSTGAEDAWSCGLWDPSRDELLVVAEDPKNAMATMRHESFHQYLHYATGRGDHAMWFNEGHATFFENVRYNSAKNSVAVLDTGNRSEWVARDPARYARQMKAVLEMPRERFYSGEVNDHYVTAWAIIYFLERGAYTADEFRDYRGICAAYLKAMDEGLSADEATRRAWAAVENRDVAADFLKFWSSRRKASLYAREKLSEGEKKKR